jgi:hypothetical protein
MSRARGRIGRFLATVLWFRIGGGWIYYVILGAYAVLIAASLWLLSRPGWLSVSVPSPSSSTA